MNLRWLLFAAVLGGGQAAAIAPASAQSASSTPDRRARAKAWGPLAALDGTIWAQGQDQVMAFGWEEPGQRFTISRLGLFGRERTIITRTAEGALHVTITGNSGDVREATVIAKGSIFTVADERAQESCGLAKQALTCTLALRSGKKWTVDRMWNWSPTTPEAAKALIARLPGIFPARPPGSFSPDTGPMNLVAGKLLRSASGSLLFTLNETSVPGNVPGISRSTFGEAGMPQGYLYFAKGRQYYGGGGVDFYPKGVTANNAPMAASVRTPTGKHALSRSSVAMSVGSDGDVRMNNLDGTRQRYFIADDGKSVLALDEKPTNKGWQETGRTIYHERVEPKLSRTFGPLAELSGKVYSIYPGIGIKYSIYGGKTAGTDYLVFNALSHTKLAQTHFISGPSGYYVSSFCTIEEPKADKATMTCQSASGTEINPLTDIRGASFVRGDRRYTVRPADINVERRGGPGKPWANWQVFASAPLSNLASGHQDLVDHQYAQQVRSQYMAERRERDAAQQAFYNAMVGLNRSLGVDTSNPSAMLRPSTPSDWAARVGTSSGSSGAPAGYGSMGSSVSVAAPQMTPAQRTQWDELQRYEIRKQLYAGQSSSGPQPGASTGAKGDSCREPFYWANGPGCTVHYVLERGFVGKQSQAACYTDVMTTALPADWRRDGDTYEAFKRHVSRVIERFDQLCRARAGPGTDWMSLSIIYDLGSSDRSFDRRPGPDDILERP